LSGLNRRNGIFVHYGDMNQQKSPTKQHCQSEEGAWHSAHQTMKWSVLLQISLPTQTCTQSVIYKTARQIVT